MRLSRVSVGSGHAHDPFTDHLYDPLRKTFQDDITSKKTLLFQAAKVSKITHQLSPKSFQEYRAMSESTLIPENAKLEICRDLSRIPPHHKYCIVNAERKKLDPISAEELQHRLGKQSHEEVIIYTYNGQREVNQKKKHGMQEEKREHSMKTMRYSFERRKQKAKSPPKAKYNLFSMIDAGINNLLEGKAWTLADNEIIASKPNKDKWSI